MPLVIVMLTAFAICVGVLLLYPPVEPFRRFLTALFGVQSRLPPACAKHWRLAVTLLLNLIPAIDPATDPLLTDYELPATVKPYDEGDPVRSRGVFITGSTGLVGVHLIDHLLRTTDKHLYCLVRARSAGKIQREAATHALALPGFAARVTLLDGDCKRPDLGLSHAQWAELAQKTNRCFHLAANSSFMATYEVLRGDWMPSYVTLLEWCAAEGVAFHLVGSVGRFAVAAPANRTRRGVWTSGYMRKKFVQHALLERYRAAGLSACWADCSYILGTLASGGANPGFHDSMWKAAAIQRAVGVAFPGDATLVPVDALVAAIWINAAKPHAALAPYMSLRLRRMLTSADIGVARTVGARAFWAAAEAAGFDARFMRAFVPEDIEELVALMHRDFEVQLRCGRVEGVGAAATTAWERERASLRRSWSRGCNATVEAPADVAALFAAVDEDAVIAANFEFAKAQFGQLDGFLPRRKVKVAGPGPGGSAAVAAAACIS